MKNSRITLLALSTLAALHLHAVRTESLTQNTYADFFAGELENVSLDNLGTLRAGPTLEEVAVLDDANIWTAIADADGNLYLGTGTEGIVYKLEPEVEEPAAEIVFKPDTLMTRALALDAEGNLFIGTSPDGAVYRIPPGGRPEVYFDPSELYIWDFTFDKDGNLYVATGAEARIYKLTPDHALNANTTPYFKSDRTHFTRLAWDESGALIAATGPDAYLYRITDEEAGEVLYSAGTDEISNVMIDGEDIYFTTWHKGGGDETPPKDLAALLAKFQMAPAGSNSSSDDDEEKEKSPAASAPSFLLKLDAYGFVSPVWSPGGANMQYTIKNGDRFLVGTDVMGRLYSVNNSDSWGLLNQAKRGGEISVILPDVGPNKITYICTSNPSVVYRLTDAATAESVYTAKPIDARSVARWGRLRPLGAPTKSPGLVIETRSGNASEPDDTWSDWAPLDEWASASPAARYLQYKVAFSEGGELRGLTAYFGVRNLPPLVGVINVMPIGLSIFTMENSNPTTLNPKELASASKTNAVLSKDKAVNQKVVVTDETGSISVAWKAFDPNGDTLSYNVALQQDGEQEWITLAEGLTDEAFSTPTRGYLDGYYSFRIIASDAPSNLPADAKTGMLISQPFLIDNTSPKVTLHNQSKDADGATLLVFAANDDWGNIVSASYRLDGQPSVEAIPTDLLFDSNEEVFRIILPGLQLGAHSIVFEALDEHGNRGLAKASFNVE